MLKKLTDLINLILNRRIADLDNDGKIETLREEIQGIFSQFSSMHDKLETVNEQLDEVIVDEQAKQEEERARLERIIEETNRRIEESNERAGKALKNKESNIKLQEKVSEFLPN